MRRALPIGGSRPKTNKQTKALKTIFSVILCPWKIRISGCTNICQLIISVNCIYGRTKYTCSVIKVRELATEFIVRYEFVSSGQTVSQVYYLGLLKSCVKTLDENDPNFLPATHGSCITKMHLLTWHCL
jgi:hypothetical protein